MEPKIRLKGYSGEWKSKKFGDFGYVSMCKRIFKYQTSSKGEIPFYKIGSFGANPDSYITRNLYEEYRRKFSFPRKGDILISAAGTVGRIVEYNGEDAYFQDSNIVWLNHNSEIENKFLKYLYPIVKWSSLEGATIKRLYNSNILETSVVIPDIEEQKALSVFFANIDSMVSASASRLASLKQIKTASLQSMFPQEGESVPKVRFKGFDGEWKKVRLGDITKGFMYGINAAAVPYDGSNKYLRITDIDDSTHIFLQDSLTTPGANLSYCDEYIMQEGDIVVARTGASVGKSYIYHESDGKVYFAGFLIRIRLEDIVNHDFVFQNTLSYQYSKYIKLVSMRSGQPGVNVDELKSYKLCIPSFEEQQKIADYFTNLDKQISLQSQRLEKLKQIKAACLDMMFV